jgi:hypothetical protein
MTRVFEVFVQYVLVLVRLGPNKFDCNPHLLGERKRMHAFV